MSVCRKTARKEGEKEERAREIRAVSAQASKHEWSPVHPYTSTFQEAFKKPNKNSKKKQRGKELKEQERRGKQADGCEPA